LKEITKREGRRCDYGY